MLMLILEKPIRPGVRLTELMGEEAYPGVWKLFEYEHEHDMTRRFV